MNPDERHRRYHSLNPKNEYPANEALFYECSRCGDIICSSSSDYAECKCKNVTIDPDGGGLSIKDASQVKLFSLTSAGRVIRPTVVGALRELSDREFQQRVWLGSSQSEVSSFVETVCELYNDSGLDKALDNRETVFSDEIDTRLRELRTAISKIDSSGSAARTIEDPHMPIVHKWAAELLRLIDPENESTPKRTSET